MLREKVNYQQINSNVEFLNNTGILNNLLFCYVLFSVNDVTQDLEYGSLSEYFFFR